MAASEVAASEGSLVGTYIYCEILVVTACYTWL